MSYRVGDKYMTLFRFIFVCFFVSSSVLTMEHKEEHENSKDYLALISSLIQINSQELNKNKSREYWLDKMHKAVSSSVFIAPYAVLYYGSALYPEYTEIIKYCFPPLTLLTYYLTLNENYKKTSLLGNTISQELEPLRELLPNIRRVLEYAYQDEKKIEFEIRDSSLLHHIEKLEQENQQVHKFVVDVLMTGAKKYQNNPDMMGQVINGSLELRLIIIFSFLRLLDRSDKDFSFFIDSKPSINIAAFDWWKVSLHSYTALVIQCAEELNNNLILLKTNSERLRTITDKVILKTILKLLAQLHTKKPEGREPMHL